jgi:DNA-binding NtrC family response regulator
VKTILILDDNVGFVFWLGKILGEAGYQAVPASDIREASALIASLGLTLDVLIMNPDAQGATRFIQTLRGQQEGLRVIAVVEDSADAHLTVAEVDGVGRRPPFVINIQNVVSDALRSVEEAAIQSRSKSEWLTLVRTATGSGRH